jgi:hypothetical protein
MWRSLGEEEKGRFDSMARGARETAAAAAVAAAATHHQT